ncbi:MAG: GNAT family N-acetyltransferase [Clostridia bacterium]|nr:GNAT family N-acetyltransferase [Clostridia bacterium]
MSYRIERLGAEDYDELLSMLNTTFRKTEGDTFDVFLPVMWERDDEHMQKHLAIRENGRIAAVVGVYPLPAEVLGEPVLFATIGNVATAKEFEGRGLMRALMTEALSEAERMGVDVARLGGKRQRYNRYGFEHAGADYQFRLTPKNLSAYYGAVFSDGALSYQGSPLSNGAPFERRLHFVPVSLQDDALLEAVMRLEKNAPLYAERGGKKQFFKTLSAYRCRIVAALDGTETPVGYLCVTPEGETVYEHRADSPSVEYQMLLEWLLASGVSALLIHTAPWEAELNALLGRISEKWGLTNVSQFHIFSWEKLAGAMLRVKAGYTHLPEGRFLCGIEDYGTLSLTEKGCEKTDEAPQLVLNRLDATRFLFGSLPVGALGLMPRELDPKTAAWVQAVLPLPLWWCNQDRV